MYRTPLQSRLLQCSLRNTDRALLRKPFSATRLIKTDIHRLKSQPTSNRLLFSRLDNKRRAAQHVLLASSVIPLHKSLIISDANLTQKGIQTNNNIPVPNIIESSKENHTLLSRTEPLKHKLIRLCQHIIQWLDIYVLEPILTLRRLTHILLLFTPVVVTAPFALFLPVGSRSSNNEYPDFGERDATLWWFDFLAKQMERAGPTFIKLAQWIASRTDLFPLALCARLSKLHSQVDPHPFRYTKKIIEQAFSDYSALHGSSKQRHSHYLHYHQHPSLDDIFDRFQEEPLGVGAIAQVYKARLKPQFLLMSLNEDGGNQRYRFIRASSESAATGWVEIIDDEENKIHRIQTDVAVKVLHPKARQIVQRDLIIMETGATLLTWLIPTLRWLSLPEEVQVFGEMMKEQLDLRGEGRNLERFNEYFKKSRTVKIPRPFMKFSTKDMLLEEYARGIPLDVFLKQALYTRQKENDSLEPVFDAKIAGIGLDAFLHMLIFYNFVHADLHPGNIMVEFYKPSAYHPLRVTWSKLTGKEITDEEGEEAVNRILNITQSGNSNDELKKATLQKELVALEQEGYSPRLVFLDTGLVNELNDVNRRNFLDLFQAVAAFDGYRVGELMVERCRSPEAVIQPDVFALRMQNLILQLKENTFHLGAVKIGNLLSQTMNMVRSHHVKMEGDFINVVVSIMLLEGIGRQLNPDLDLLKSAIPVLRNYSIKEGSKVAVETAGKKSRMKNQEKQDADEGGTNWIIDWLKVWIFLELRTYLGQHTRDEEWLQLCDILCPNAI
ncbi:hypothetical protein BDF20DRAFT_841809 [Mycotypha africana]|uniref:uncharacterized protein n=1 Tax=Mycotypha africana TaxID=64632 RepID=UPI002300CB74|nr:uncharacterized protein BDF20DRAFT_841809 [Mycotypha africana]KAI8990948.1 hypothetical protein BDF20DRAFT_841809 [Mycotypha africana]